MKIILFLIFVSGASAIFITCQFNYVYNWHSIGYRYTCSIIAMDFSDNATHITGYNGTHLGGNSSIDVRAVNIEQYRCPSFNLTKIPQGILSIFPNFIILRLWECAIIEFSGHELQEYPNLQWFGFAYTDLERVPGNMFESTPDIIFIDFALNKIKHVADGLFDGLDNAQYISFYSNVCIDKTAYSASEIPALIEALRQNCTDIEPETTNQPPRCEINDLEDFVCGLDADIENLKENDENLQNQVDILTLRNDALEAENQEMKAKLEEHAAALLELERKVIDLTTRPCAC